MPSDKFEAEFQQMAQTIIASKAVALQPYMVGFHVLDSNEEQTRAVGVFGYKVGAAWLYSPIFFLGGRVKGTELLYVANNRSFVPQTEDWINDIIGANVTMVGGPSVPASEMMNRNPDLDFLDKGYNGRGDMRHDFYRKGASEVSLGEWQTRKVADGKALLDIIKDPKKLCKAGSDTLNNFSLDGQLKQFPKLARTMHTWLKHRKVATAAVNSIGLDRMKWLVNECTKLSKLASVQVNTEDVPGDRYDSRSVVITADNAGDHLLTDADRSRLAGDGFVLKKDTGKRVVKSTTSSSFVTASAPGTYKLLQTDSNPIDAVVFKDRWDDGFVALCSDGFIREPKAPDHCECAYQSSAPKRLDFRNTFIVVDEKPTNAPAPLKLSDLLVPKSGQKFCYLLVEPSGKVGFSFLPSKVDTSGVYVEMLALVNDGVARQMSSFAGNSETRIVFSTKAKSIVYSGDIKIVPATSKVYKINVAENYEEARNSEAERTQLVTGDYLVEMMLQDRESINVDNSGYQIKMDLPSGTFLGNKKEAAEVLAAADLAAKDIYRILETPGNSVWVTRKKADEPDDALATHVNGEYYGYPQVDGRDSFTERAFPQGLHMDLADTNPALQRALRDSSNEKVPQMFDVSLLRGMLRSADVSELVKDMLPALTKGMNTLGQLLFLYYWHNDSFAERYGRDEMADMEDGLQNVFRSLGELTLYLKQKSPASIDDFGELEISSSGIE